MKVIVYYSMLSPLELQVANMDEANDLVEYANDLGLEAEIVA